MVDAVELCKASPCAFFFSCGKHFCCLAIHTCINSWVRIVAIFVLITVPLHGCLTQERHPCRRKPSQITTASSFPRVITHLLKLLFCLSPHLPASVVIYPTQPLRLLLGVRLGGGVASPPNHPTRAYPARHVLPCPSYVSRSGGKLRTQGLGRLGTDACETQQQRQVCWLPCPVVVGPVRGKRVCRRYHGRPDTSTIVELQSFRY